MKGIRAAVLGAGGMGETVISHLKSCPEVDAIIAYDLDPARVRDKVRRFSIRGASDLGEILADPATALVCVTASNDAHKDLTLRSIEAGKAVLCEKPMANTLGDSLEMVEAAERKGTFFQIGFELRYSRLYTTVMEWIEAGLLGRIVNVSCRYVCSEFHHKGSWRNVKATNSSMFGEKLSHYVDLPRWWIGSEVVEVYSACAPNVIPYYEVRDNYHTVCRFADGAVSQLTFLMAPAATFDGDPLQNVIDQQKGDGHELRYLVQGTKGVAETDVFNRTIKRWEFGDSPECMTSRWVEALTWPGEEDGRYFHNTLDQTHDVVRRVRQGLPPRTSARDSYETMRVCFAAELSADTGKPVRLDALG